jgi:hypothetical protein
MTKNFFTLLIFSLFSIAVAFTGCSEPVGSLLYSVDYIKAVPTRSILYGEGDWFKPAQDVKVIGVFGGVEDEIDIDEVKIKIIHDPGFTIETEDTVSNNQTGLRLTSKGPKAVVISYKNMEARYDIAVGEPGMGDGGWGDGEGSGIILNW